MGLSLIASALLQAAIVAVVLIALIDLARRALRLDDLAAFCAGVLALGLLGYLSFWLAWLDYTVFTVVRLIVLAALLVHFGFVCRRGLATCAFAAEPLIFTFLFFLVVVTLGFSDGGIENPLHTPQIRFSHPLPGDNVIPLLVANALRDGHIASPLFGDWLASDRPPLQTGLYLLLIPRNVPLSFADLAIFLHDTLLLGEVAINYQVVSVLLQATFLFGVWAIASAAGLAAAARRLVLLACCLLPTALINTFYVWPKMLAAGYLLLCFALLFGRPRPRSDRDRLVLGVLIGGFAALSVLSHGASFFGLIGFTAVVVLFWAWPPLQTMAAGAVTVALCYLPWIGFQRFIDPPGDRLVKWHLAGVTEVDPRGTLEALRDAYGALTWHDYVAGRLTNLMTLIGTWPDSLAADLRLVVSHDPGLAGGVRAADFFNLLPSLHLFSLALIVALPLLVMMRAEEARARAVALRLLVALVATNLFFVIVVFIPGQTINHVGTYATQLMAVTFAFIVLATRAPWLAAAFIAVQFVTVATAYAFTRHHDVTLWPLLALCIAATLGLFAYAFAPLRRLGKITPDRLRRSA